MTDRTGIAGHDQALAGARDALRASPVGFVLFTLTYEDDSREHLIVEPLVSLPDVGRLSAILRNMALALELAADSHAREQGE